MKKVLYITNIEVPYRVAFFNELAKYCDLTVLYERKKSSNRAVEWNKDNHIQYKTKYLSGINNKREYTFSFSIIHYCFGQYDEVIIGCYNSLSQMLAILIMRLFRRKYSINIDGETFINGNTFKDKMKRFFLKGASKYYTAGEQCSDTLKMAIGSHIRTIPYYFSSLTEYEVQRNSEIEIEREDFILVVGQYFSYKGMDIAAEVAKQMPEQKFVFVGMGTRTGLFEQECGTHRYNNISTIPFLSKNELNKLYASCKLLLLPSRQECWGLVVNEASSFGTPIVATTGSGSAVEFLNQEFPNALVSSDSIEALKKAIIKVINSDSTVFSAFLKQKSKKYTIEKNVKYMLDSINEN